MVTLRKRTSRKRPPKPPVRLQPQEPVAEQVEKAAQPFDEPATSMPAPAVPVEQPPSSSPEDRDTCSLPDEATTRASDLH